MLLFATSFDQYGTGSAAAYRNSDSDGGYDFAVDDWTILGDAINNQPAIGSNNNHSAKGAYRIQAPEWGARRGDYAFMADGCYLSRYTFGGTAYYINGGESPRFNIPGVSQHVRIIHLAFSIDALPAEAGSSGMILGLQNGSGVVRGYIGVNPSGRLVVYNGSSWGTATATVDVQLMPTVLATTSTPVISAETWVSLNIKITTNGSDGNANIQIYAGDIIPANLVLDGTALELSGTGEIDVLGLFPPSFSGKDGSGSPGPDTTKRYMRDLVVCNNTGTYNNDHLGQVFVAAQELRGEAPGGGWEAFPRSNISDGVLNHSDASTGIRIGDNANLELGSGDYTLEGFFRFDALPVAGTVTLLSKWQANDDNRSWKLFWDGNADELKFSISTDGVAETELYVYPWIPDTDKYYHIAAVRDTAEFRLFVNGTQLGVDIADANTYFNGTANVGVMSEWNSGNTLVSATVLSGFVDEVRFSVGLSRYATDFTPTTVPFGRDVGGDANIANVELLMGFDGSTIEDESSNAFTVTVGAGVVAIEPDDDNNSYEVLNRRPAWDDTYIEARNTFATGILTLTANPLTTETITLGAVTYTFRTVLSTGPTVANEILIGANVAETLVHVVEAVNGGTGLGTDFSVGTVANPDIFASALPSPQALFTATAIGAAGNSEASTETLSNGSFSAATLLGGEDIPSPSDFAIERLPVDVTGVLGMQVTARGFKSDAGSASLRFDLVGPAAAVDTGTPLGTDLNPAWLRQVFEEDPDTSATITPSTVTGGKIRVTRTA